MQPPQFPEIPSAQRTRAEISLRYEDLAQDGSLKVNAMLMAIGLSLSRSWFQTAESRALRAQGVLPILTRLVMQSTDGPLSVFNKLDVEGAYLLGHSRVAGEVNRIVLNGYADLYGIAGRTHPPEPHNAGARLHVGRVFAEHVFTRPFAPAGERKVLALRTEHGLRVPEHEVASYGPRQTLELTPDRWLEPGFSAEASPVVFGLMHTDANQHVNSLIYPRLFEEAALRRVQALGRSTDTLLVELVDVAYRKPCFAGERVELWLRAFEHQGQLGAVAYLGPEGSDADNAHCMCALRFRAGSMA